MDSATVVVDEMAGSLPLWIVRVGVAVCDVSKAPTSAPRWMTHFEQGHRQVSKHKRGVPPFGHSTTLRIFIDPDLLQYDETWAAAGTWNDVFPIAPNDLVHASGAVVTDLKRA